MKLKGNGQISSAAAALNNAIMGNEAKASSEAENKNILSISSDQMYVGEKTNDQVKSTNEEAAAITMAKEAAKQFAQKHPDT